MEYRWDRFKPNGISDTKWKRDQISKFLRRNPGTKPRNVLAWINSQTPNPWPLCDTNKLGKLMRRIMKSESGDVLVQCDGEDVPGQGHIDNVLVQSHGIARTDNIL